MSARRRPYCLVELICCGVVAAVANTTSAQTIYNVFNMPAGLTSLKFSNVGDPGNVGDTVSMNTAPEDQLWISGSADTSSGYGAVPYQYGMGTYDVTVAQYVQFLNAVATTGDPYGLYNPLMGGGHVGPRVVRRHGHDRVLHPDGRYHQLARGLRYKANRHARSLQLLAFDQCRREPGLSAAAGH